MTDARAKFTLNLLGPFRFTGPDGERIPISSRKAEALIALLATAIEGERTRGWLLEKLWSTRELEQGQGSLRREISNLRSQLAVMSDTILLADRYKVRLDIAQIRVDARAYLFSDYSEGASIWSNRGEFLEGLDLRGEEGFEDWLREQRSALRESISVGEFGKAASRPGQNLTSAASRRASSDSGLSVSRTSSASVFADQAQELRDTARTAQRSTLTPRPYVCLIPFLNMSADAEQDYFSDGISEDIITDLSKISSLSVVARHTAFALKNRAMDVRQVASEFEVSHVLGGSVRKAGSRVRISAHLTNAVTADQIWADRWDRDLIDIFTLQDEISQAVVAALRLKLLPEERRAIERRGTANPDAYNLYLMARQRRTSGNEGDSRREREIIRLGLLATNIDPNYAHAWALVALSQSVLHYYYRASDDDGLAAAERALSLDPNLADAHAVRARHLANQGKQEESVSELESALLLDPDCWEANKQAGLLYFRQHQFEDAVSHYRKSTDLMETDYSSPMMLMTCCAELGNVEDARHAARIARIRAERAVAQDQSNGSAMATACMALAFLGDADAARDWARRALVIDPANLVMRYNLACALSAHLKDVGGALDILEIFFAQGHGFWLAHAKADPDLHPLRGDPRFKAMIEATEARVAAASQAAPANGAST